MVMFSTYIFLDLQKGSNLAHWQTNQGELYVVQFSHDETSCYSMGSDSKVSSQ